MTTGQKAEGRRQKPLARSAGSSLRHPALRDGTDQTLLQPSSFALLIALMGGMSSAWGQIANDPTRPPSGYATESADPAADAGGLTLQSILISPSHKAAIISGVMVKEGEKLGEAVLVKVAENEVVLRTAGVSQVLKLYPGVDKREVAPAGKGTAQRGKAAGAPPR
jgi:MSHA biogenesis protein MshK